MAIDTRIADRKRRIADQRTPLQQRSRQRRDEILRITAALLEQVGFNDLTTILIAGELGISVGSLYHYFPNKQAILYALGEQWLAEQTRALEEIGAHELEGMAIPAFIELAFTRLLRVYREQRGLMPLVQAMWAVPELRELDERHDEVVISHLSEMFRRLGLPQDKAERARLGRLMLELVHALFLSVVEQPPARARRSLQDVKSLGVTLLQSRASTGP